MSLFVHRHIQAEEDGSSALICSNPLLGNFKLMRFMLLSIAAFLVVTILFTHTTFYLSGLTSRSGLSGFFMSLWPELYGPLESSMLWSGVLLIGAFIAGSWKRIERLRFSAASGNERLQALNQPRSDAEALQLPITLTLRMTRLFAFFVALPSLLL